MCHKIVKWFYKTCLITSGKVVPSEFRSNLWWKKKNAEDDKKKEEKQSSQVNGRKRPLTHHMMDFNAGPSIDMNLMQMRVFYAWFFILAFGFVHQDIRCSRNLHT